MITLNTNCDIKATPVSNSTSSTRDLPAYTGDTYNAINCVLMDVEVLLRTNGRNNDKYRAGKQSFSRSSRHIPDPTGCIAYYISGWMLPLVLLYYGYPSCLLCLDAPTSAGVYSWHTCYHAQREPSRVAIEDLGSNVLRFVI